MNNEEVLTVTQAAAYLGMNRTTIAGAAQRGEIGAKQKALGTRAGWIYVFTREELDTWKARDRHPGGRPPKAEAGTLS